MGCLHSTPFVALHDRPCTVKGLSINQFRLHAEYLVPPCLCIDLNVVML